MIDKVQPQSGARVLHFLPFPTSSSNRDQHCSSSLPSFLNKTSRRCCCLGGRVDVGGGRAAWRRADKGRRLYNNYIADEGRWPALSLINVDPLFLWDYLLVLEVVRCVPFSPPSTLRVITEMMYTVLVSWNCPFSHAPPLTSPSSLQLVVRGFWLHSVVLLRIEVAHEVIPLSNEPLS